MRRPWLAVHALFNLQTVACKKACKPCLDLVAVQCGKGARGARAGFECAHEPWLARLRHLVNNALDSAAHNEANAHLEANKTVLDARAMNDARSVHAFAFASKRAARARKP